MQLPSQEPNPDNQQTQAEWQGTAHGYKLQYVDANAALELKFFKKGEGEKNQQISSESQEH